MIRTVTVVPAVLAESKIEYRKQIERINYFSRRVHIDVSDGNFAPASTIDISNVWWPKEWKADIHLMAAFPSQQLDIILKLKPSLCILHAEASEDLLPIFATLKQNDIRTGLALLPSTYPGLVKQYIDYVDHVLIFAGQLGVQGSPADMMQMEKIGIVRSMKPELEIGWDGGANKLTMRALAHADLDVINVGSALSKVENPAEVYHELVAEIDKNGVVI
jgi:ribulose-phosphate 3-epimerase